MHREEYTDSDYRLGAKWEKRVEDIAVRYYGFKGIKRGKGAGVSHKFKEFGERETGFDFLFELPNGSRIWIEVTGDKQYTWEKSSFFPIQPLKVKRAENLPEETYIVYYLDRDESCFWLPMKRCGQFKDKKIETKKGLQIKHLVIKEAWHRIKGRNNWERSLQDLCEFLIRGS